MGGGSPGAEGRKAIGSSGRGQVRRKRSVRRLAIRCWRRRSKCCAWGDVGMYPVTPAVDLGAAAVQAAGTPEQKAKFLARFGGEKPTFAAMCMTEAGAGSDTSAIRTRAVLDEKTKNGSSTVRRSLSPAAISRLPSTKNLARALSSSGHPLTRLRGGRGCVPLWSRLGRRV